MSPRNRYQAVEAIRDFLRTWRHDNRICAIVRCLLRPSEEGPPSMPLGIIQRKQEMQSGWKS